MESSALAIASLEERVAFFKKSHLETLYLKHASKIYGFLLEKGYSQQKSEEILITIFLKVWKDIATFNDNEENKIMLIVLSQCRSMAL